MVEFFQLQVSSQQAIALDIYAQDVNGERTIQCVVSNLASGLVSNYDLVSNIKQMNPGCDIAVLVDSEQDEEVSPLRELGVTDFIKKPYSMPEFSKILAKVTTAPEEQQG